MIKDFMDPNPKINSTKLSGVETQYLAVHGDLEGIIEITSTAVVDMTNGKFTSDGVATFTGKLKDREGSFVYTVKGSCQFTSMTGDSGTATSDSTIVRGMGGLAGISGTSHSESKFSPTGGTSTYTGTCKFQ